MAFIGLYSISEISVFRLLNKKCGFSWFCSAIYRACAVFSSSSSARLYSFTRSTYNLSNIEQLLKSFAEKKEKQFRTRFLISGPKHLYTVQVSDIAYFYSEDKITFAVTKDTKTHVIDFPLNKLEEQLDDRMFFRANRQFILSADAIKSIQNHFNGKAVVSVIPPYSETIYISREKVSLLKMWLNS